MLIALVTLISAAVAWLRGGRLKALLERPLDLRGIIRLQGVPVLLLGVLCNVAVMAANGGQMPVSVPAAAATGADTTFLVEGLERRHTALTPDTRLPYLGDILRLPAPLSRVVSIGDLLIVFALFFVLQDMMGVRVRLFQPQRDG